MIENDTFSLFHDQENDILIQRWYGHLTEEGYKNNMHWLVEWIIKRAPIKNSLVYPHIDFPIPPDLQEWTLTHVFLPTANKGFLKAAFIIPEEMNGKIDINLLSVEQTMDESEGLFETRYFIREEDARAWFASAH
ncbi:MAG: hypothetical protein HC880_17855 [Bacteroidia bacterium]|nr:hypothetical protein [Bacteroidia bacterium]